MHTDYVEYLGLEFDPFTRSEPLFYCDNHRRDLLEQLAHLCQFSSSAVALLGVAGSGKSALLNVFLEKFAGYDHLCLLDLDATSKADAVLKEICLSFGLLSDVQRHSSGQLLAKIRHFGQSGDEGSFAFIVIKNAHKLDDRLLGALLSLLQGPDEGVRRLHILLLGEPDLIERLDQFGVTDVLIQDLHLEAFKPGDIEPYLSYKLNAAGYDGQPLFNETDIDEFMEVSKGLPAVLDSLAQERLSKWVSSQKKEQSLLAQLPLGHLAALFVLVAVLVLALGTRDKETVSSTEISLNIPSEPAQSSTESNQDHIELRRKKVESLSSDTQGESLPAVLTSAPSNTDSSEKKVSSEGSDRISSDNNNKSSSTSDDMNSKLRKQRDNVSRQELKTIASASSSPVVASKSIASSAPVALPESVKVQSAEPDTDQVKKSDIIKPDFATKADLATSNSHNPLDSLSIDEEELLAGDQSAFTLQILGAASRSSVREFISRQPNRSKLKVFTTRYRGNDWFVVVVGEYPDAVSAKTAIRLLPSEQKKASPWPRSLSSVQADIRDYRGI